MCGWPRSSRRICTELLFASYPNRAMAPGRSAIHKEAAWVGFELAIDFEYVDHIARNHNGKFPFVLSKLGDKRL